MLISCTSTDHKDAGAALGNLAAGINLQPAPAECLPNAADVPHATVRAGDNGIVVLRRERGQLDKANALRRMCAVDREETRKAFNREATRPVVPK